MSTLFSTDAPIELAPPHVARALVDEYGYKPEKVKQWSREKAEAILKDRRRRDHQDENHGAAAAANQEARDPRVLTPAELVQRVDVAAYLEQARATGDASEMLLALTHAMHPLTAGELADAAGVVIVQLRLNPLTLEPIGFHTLTVPAPPPKEATGERA